MATKQQTLRAKKQAKRQKAAKDKAKLARVERAHGKYFDGDAELTEKSRKSLYDIINSRDELQARAKKMKKKERRQRKKGENDFIGRNEMLSGMHSMIDMTIKIHSAVGIFHKLVAEKRFEPTAEELTTLDNYERAVVEFSEDVSAVTILDEAKKLPEDYVDITLHLVDIMQDLEFVHRPLVDKVLSQRGSLIEAYAQEHKSPAVSMYSFMSLEHQARLAIVTPLYSTGASQEMLQHLKELDELLSSEPDDLDDLDNLPPVDENDLSIVAVQEPNDPVSQAHQ